MAGPKQSIRRAVANAITTRFHRQLDMFTALDAVRRPTATVIPLAPAQAPVPDVAVAMASAAPGGTFYLDGDRALAPTWMDRARANVRAIALAGRIAAAGRPATRGEQDVLALYTGFGASDLANGVFRNPGETGFRPGWGEVGRDLEGTVTAEEYAALARGTQYAHFTPERIVRAIWAGVTRMGFAGGRVLEPGIGTGLFASLVPAALRDTVRFTGVEADPVTARIAALLHPAAEIRVEDFGATAVPAHFALAVGNPPFSTLIVRTDPAYRALALPLHDFFIVKAVDRLMPGGLAAFVTSQGAMDKGDPRARRHLARRADLLGAIRLPQGTFAATAGTDVGVDILFLRRRRADEAGNGVDWIDTAPAGIAGHPDLHINRYFRDHPAMVLGRSVGERGRFGPEPVYACKRDPARDLDADLAAAVACLPSDVADADPDLTAAPDAAPAVAVVSGGNGRLREGSYLVADDVLMQVVDGTPAPVAIKTGSGTPGIFGKHARLIRALIPIRDAVRAILAAQERQACAKAAQDDLGRLYDAFVAAHGPINATTVTPRVDEATGARMEIHRPHNLVPFRDDPDCWLVASIEHYDIETDTATKGLIFHGVVIAPTPAPVIESASDALALCLHEHGRVDLGTIAATLGRTEAAVVEELGDTIYRDPTAGTWDTADAYLSGKVRDKLAAALVAAKADPAYARNVTALENVQPTDLPPSDITARLGAPWIPAKTIQTFLHEVVGVFTPVRHYPDLAAWGIEEMRFAYVHAVNQKWGTHRYDAGRIVLDALNARTPQVFDEVRNGSSGSTTRVLNEKETEAAKEKLVALKTAFENWVWRDHDRAETLARIYNDTFNNLVARRFDGSHLRLPGASAAFAFYPHQKNVIWRMIAAGGTYIAHAVGAGKTASIAAAIMEQRRLGLVTKAMLTVPGHCLAQCAREFLALYPLAKILVADETNFAKDKRRRFLARAATGDWDAIIITHSAFKLIPLPVAFERRMMEDQVAEYEALLTTVDQADRVTRKGLERRKEAFKNRIASLAARKDDFLTISEIGVDQIHVDEAQEFRKLSFTTNQASLKGIDSDGSQAAWDLYCKAAFVRERRALYAGGDVHAVDRALNLASGTPITNTLGEMFTAQRFMGIDALRERKLQEFDAWAAAFGETRTELELQPSGAYKPVTRFAEFVNVPELIAMFRAFADVVSAKDLGRLVKRPRVATGRRQIITAPPSDAFKDYQNTLAGRIKAIEMRRGPPQKGDDILLSVITDGRHAAIDMRLVLSGYGDEPDNKLNRLVDNIHAIYRDTADRTYQQPDGAPYERPGGTQMVFSDLGTLTVEASRGFSAYRWIKHRLVALGIPADEIAFVQDYKGSQAKNRLFAEMRAGKVRVTIGSTKKMGTGVNAQNRMVALHHLDVPWLPSDIEQREGRIERQGNQNAEIGIFAYATEGSMDATMWQTNERKARFIEAALSGDRSVRRLEDIGEGSVNQFAMAKAIASGDPRLMQKAGLEAEIARLERLRSAHHDEQHVLRGRIRSAERHIESTRETVAALDNIIAARGPMSAPFAITVGAATFTDPAEAGKALTTAMRDLDFAATTAKRGRKPAPTPIATARGLAIWYETTASGEDDVIDLAEIVAGGLRFDVRIHAKTPGAVAIQKLEDRLGEFEAMRDRNVAGIARAEAVIAETTPNIGRPFPLSGELAIKLQSLAEIDIALAGAEALRAAA